MTLIKSISGIRGTIGGKPGDNLTPADIVRFTSAYAGWLKERHGPGKMQVILGRDARVSGVMVQNLVSGTLQGSGIDVIDLGLATTPTTEMAVIHLKAQGGIIITASHNPAQWNALKLLNELGEFLSADDGKRILDLAAADQPEFSPFNLLGSYSGYTLMNRIHIDAVVKLSYVDIPAIKKANFRVAIDCVNSVGSIILPDLLKALGVADVIQLYCEPNGLFPHNPEPLPENLKDISNLIKSQQIDVGFVVDPDVDRLAIVCEDGTMFGEEYTLVAIADFILNVKKGGNTVSNLSSTQALQDITKKHGGTYKASAVGEVNVVAAMKEIQAVIGGEGNGGVIFPELHYGRDALVGIALFLTQLARSGLTCSKLRATYPDYVISKNKIELQPGINLDSILARIKSKYARHQIIDIDGVKILFEGEWVHLRKSNTEPIIRIYSESRTEQKANELAKAIMDDIMAMIGT